MDKEKILEMARLEEDEFELKIESKAGLLFGRIVTYQIVAIYLFFTIYCEIFENDLFLNAPFCASVLLSILSLSWIVREIYVFTKLGKKAALYWAIFFGITVLASIAAIIVKLVL